MEAPNYLLLFAKYPYHGKVKTRLEPALGVDNAQIFARTALIEVLQYFGRLSEKQAEENKGKICCRCIWCYAPSSAADDVQQLLREYDLDKIWQAWPQLDTTSNLGHRLAASVKRVEEELDEETTNTVNNTKRPTTCTLIGSDCFQLTTSHIKSSIQAASPNDSNAILLPANDGGYVLLSLPIPIAADSIFDNIRWSSAETANDQRRQLEKEGLTVKIGDTLSDVDEPADLKHLLLDLNESQDGNHFKTFYPRTIAFVQEHMKRIQG